MRESEDETLQGSELFPKAKKWVKLGGNRLCGPPDKIQTAPNLEIFRGDGYSITTEFDSEVRNGKQT